MTDNTPRAIMARMDARKAAAKPKPEIVRQGNVIRLMLWATPKETA